jgi:hypothetical protein
VSRSKYLYFVVVGCYGQPCSSDGSIISLDWRLYKTFRRKKREEKGEKEKAPARTSKRKAAETKAKEPPKKKAKEAEPAEVPDTSNDAEIAAKLAADTRGTGRNRDATGAKSKKASALAKLREVSLFSGHGVTRYLRVENT